MIQIVMLLGALASIAVAIGTWNAKPLHPEIEKALENTEEII